MDNSSTNPWDYLDFELEIRKGGQGKYSAHVLRSPDAGEPEEEVRFPFTEGELVEKLGELEDALYSFGESRSSKTRSDETRRLTRTPEQTIQVFGEDLFQALFTGEINACYRMSLRNAKDENKGLRLKLRIHPSSGLVQVPWEFLYDPAFKRYLCLSSKRPLVRYLSLPQPVKPLRVESPLRILGMVANPSDPMLDELDVAHEKELLEKAVNSLEAKGLVELRWVDGQSYEALLDEMLEGRWHVFHFIGHGDFDLTKQKGAIVLANEEGKPHSFPAKKLANTLSQNDDLRLVFLNSCEGARGSENDAFSSAAATLVSQGVAAAAVAMQYEISDEAAISFSRAFYRAVAKGLPVDAAVATARTSLDNEMDDTLEWATPVLYTHSPDGRIFDVQEDPDGRDRGVEGNALEVTPKRHETAAGDEDSAESTTAGLHRTARGAQHGLRTEGDATLEGTGERSSEAVSGSVREQSSFRYRIAGWLGSRRRMAVVGAIVTSVLLVLGIAAFGYANTSSQTRAIESLLVSHYENVGVERYEEAFADFSENEQDRIGGLEGWIASIDTWCQDVGADVREPEISEIDGDKAQATVSVVYESSCGKSPRRFDSEWLHVWNLSRETGEWKLDSREEDDQLVYTHEPAEVENGGDTRSEFEGAERGSLKAITTSATAFSTVDDCGEEVSFEPANMVDGRSDASWEVAGNGIGELILLEYDKPIRVSSLSILPGHAKEDPCSGTDRFYQMYVVREVEVEFSDGTEVKATFERNPELQPVNIPVQDIETTSIRITILDTYPPGDKPDEPANYYDLRGGTFGKAAISEIKVTEP